MGVQVGLDAIRTGYFSFSNRGTKGHWDIYNKERRLFCIRGEPGNFGIRDETGYELVPKDLFFHTDAAAMGYLCDMLGTGVE